MIVMVSSAARVGTVAACGIWGEAAGRRHATICSCRAKLGTALVVCPWLWGREVIHATRRSGSCCHPLLPAHTTTTTKNCYYYHYTHTTNTTPGPCLPPITWFTAGLCTSHTNCYTSDNTVLVVMRAADCAY